MATMKGCLEMSSIEEAAGNESAEQMVQVLETDFTKVVGELKKVWHWQQSKMMKSLVICCLPSTVRLKSMFGCLRRSWEKQLNNMRTKQKTGHFRPAFLLLLTAKIFFLNHQSLSLLQ